MRLRPGEIFCYLLLLCCAILPIALPHARPSILAPSTAPGEIDPPDATTLLPARYIVGVYALTRSSPASLPPHLSEQLLTAAHSPAERFRALLVQRFLDGPDAADAAIRQLADENRALAPDARFILDRDAATAPGVESPAASEAGFRKRHGFFASVALVQDLPDSDPARAAVLSAALRTTLTLLGAGITALGATVVGVVLLILLIVNRVRGKLQPAFPRSPLPADRQPYLEAFTLYLLLLIPVPLLLARLDYTPMGLMIALYVLAPVMGIVWPLVRGRSWAEFRAAAALNTGKGVFREMGAGVVGYVAGLPLIALALLFSLLLTALAHKVASHPIQNVISSDPKVLAVLFALASLYAPLFEELTFRGLFYAQLRTRFAWVPAAILSSVLFAAIHPQGWTLIPGLATIGFVLATLREHRNSILASMTAHALNNTFALVVMAIALT